MICLSFFLSSTSPIFLEIPSLLRLFGIRTQYLPANDKKVVIYQEDYQPIDNSIVDDFVENIAACFYLGVSDDQGNKLYEENVDFIGANSSPLCSFIQCSGKCISSK